MGQKIDLTGMRFGRLRVIGETEERDASGNIKWRCKCDCGNEKNILSQSLRRGVTLSCGCYQKERVSKLDPKSKRKLYRRYWSMRNRCEYTGDKHFYCYGGRGIKVCDEWKNYETFEQWALNNGFKEGLTLDRIDIDGDYSPDNCRWITHKEQQSNRRDNVYITFNGERRTVQQWSEITGIKKSTIQRRIALNWEEKDLLNPVNESRSHGESIKKAWDKRKQSPCR